MEGLPFLPGNTFSDPTVSYGSVVIVHKKILKY